MSKSPELAESAPSKKMYGWFSEKQKRFSQNINYHEKPGKISKIQNIFYFQDHKTVEVTQVTNDPNFVHPFKDAVFVGELDKHSFTRQCSYTFSSKNRENKTDIDSEIGGCDASSGYTIC